ncbi:hypothetical protein B0F90DRAFT_1818896 [Multifurca ochricompacta]|uniref:Uncharacterized protein n=1 Tax=Multifurca ochricompacta TaxID=376703 RepID=A0AAD4M390_9AGAM|nr:hypothetical protein B0F90DRAFT_1818896 [Multifurca ochricompacta]
MSNSYFPQAALNLQPTMYLNELRYSLPAQMLKRTSDRCLIRTELLHEQEHFLVVQASRLNMRFAATNLFALPATAVVTFVPPSLGPTVASDNYVGASNGSFPEGKKVHEKSFARFVQVVFQTSSPSEDSKFTLEIKSGLKMKTLKLPTRQDFWDMASDDLFNIPSNIATIVDLLATEGFSWASYQERLPTDVFASADYVMPDAVPYEYYKRKHDPLIIYDSVATVPARPVQIRNFNDFVVDVNASDPTMALRDPKHG